MALILYILAAISAVLLIINNLARTAMRQQKLRLVEIGLVFFVVLLGTAALLVDNLETTRFDQIENLVLLLIIPIAILHLGLTIVEIFRPQRLKQSRGLLGLGVAILLAGATASYNLVSLNIQLGTIDQNQRPTPVNNTDGVDPCAVALEQITVNLANQLLDEVGLTIEEAFVVIEENPDQSIADLIEANDGNPVVFTRQLIDDTEDILRDLLARACLDQNAATGAIAALPVFVPQLVYNDLSELLEQFQEDNPDAAEALTEADATEIAAGQETVIALVNQEPSPLPTLTSTPTATVTPTPTSTRTPRPTLSPTPSRAPFETDTPTPTATLPLPCVASTDFNVNLRDYPSLEETEVLILIPFGSSLTIFNPNPEGTWWYASYRTPEGEDLTGWISDEFITVSVTCFDLPPREPPFRR